VTYPIKRVIGFGTIGRKFVGDTVLWPDEELFARVIWRYRVEFSVELLAKDWNEGVLVPKDLMLNMGRRVVGKGFFLELMRMAEFKWNPKVRTNSD
jgi:hypothetical protein